MATQGAEERALALLRSLCAPEQLATLDSRGWLAPVFGTMGGIFGFAPQTRGRSTCGPLFYQVWEFSPADGRDLYRWCVVPGGYAFESLSAQRLPESDWIIGIKLLLETDEHAFRQVAQCQWDHRGNL